jgi:hypothetical protein
MIIQGVLASFPAEVCFYILFYFILLLSLPAGYESANPPQMKHRVAYAGRGEKNLKSDGEENNAVVTSLSRSQSASNLRV